MVAEWADLWQIFEVYATETGYEGGVKLRKPWWQQAAADQQLEATLKTISAAGGGAAATGIRQV